MRLEQRADHDRCEFWLVNVDKSLWPALERLWWERRPGGAWRRRFEPAAAHQADPAFENLQRLLVPMLRQVAGFDPVPWATALAETCARFCPAGIDWWLGGSAALAIRGAPLTPGDLDLIVSAADSVRAGDLFLDCLVEPVTGAEWPLSDWWGRAFTGARVEWAGGVTAAADQPRPTDFGPVAAAALETVRWRDWDIRVPPLRLQRAVAASRGLTSRVALIDQLCA
jgi:hypothetical protein